MNGYTPHNKAVRTPYHVDPVILKQPYSHIDNRKCTIRQCRSHSVTSYANDARPLRIKTMPDEKGWMNDKRVFIKGLALRRAIRLRQKTINNNAQRGVFYSTGPGSDPIQRYASGARQFCNAFK